MFRALIRISTTLVAVTVCVLASRPLLAGNDLKRTVEFLGFTETGDKYLLKIMDANIGDFFSLRAFDTGKQVKSFPIENPKEEKKLLEETKKAFKITDKGTEGQTSPDERYNILGVPKGDKFQINITRGERSAKFKTIDLASNAAGPAKAMLKNVHWSKDCKRIVLIIHQTLVDENGIDADEARPFDFLVGGLNFK